MVALLLLACLIAAGCRRAMYDDGRLKPYEPAPFFADGNSTRPWVPGTVPRKRHLSPERDLTPTGLTRSTTLAISPDQLRRGQERYVIFCAPCHDRIGQGNGPVVQRGFPTPASFHEPRLRDASDFYFYSSIIHGYERMAPMAHQIPVADSWAIVAYIRALQRSQFASAGDVTIPPSDPTKPILP